MAMKAFKHLIVILILLLLIIIIIIIIIIIKILYNTFLKNYTFVKERGRGYDHWLINGLWKCFIDLR